MNGIKYDDGKPDLSMVSLELMEEVAYVRMFGAKKYARDNWKLGFKVTRSCAAALRHIFKFLSGETIDPESGRSHLAHAVCCLEHAIYDMRHRPENDDRSTAKELTVKTYGIPFSSSSEEIRTELEVQSKHAEELAKRRNDWIAR